MNKLYHQVKELLERFPLARDNDFFLYWQIVKDKIDESYPLRKALKDMEKKRIPSFDTVSRVRRKVQQEAASSDKKYLCGNRLFKKKKEQQVKKEIVNGTYFGNSR